MLSVTLHSCHTCLAVDLKKLVVTCCSLKLATIAEGSIRRWKTCVTAHCHKGARRLSLISSSRANLMPSYLLRGTTPDKQDVACRQDVYHAYSCSTWFKAVASKRKKVTAVQDSYISAARLVMGVKSIRDGDHAHSPEACKGESIKSHPLLLNH